MPPPTRARATRRGPTIDDRSPIRTCVGCRLRRPATELVRVTRSGDGARAAIRVGGPSFGRGAWLCRSTAIECCEAAIRGRRFDRSWRRRVDERDHDELRGEVRRFVALTSETTNGASPDEGTTTGKG